MKRILITDTHFGWKQNSITWLNSQIKFIDEQVIPTIKKLRNETGEYIRIIHLGDVFDSRSSISPMIAKIVREKFVELANLVDDFYIVAGNHDFYSPNSSEFDSLSMVFRDCGIHLVIDDIAIADGDMFIPWYQYKNDIKPLLSQHPDIRNIYTHADIFGEDRRNINDYVGIKIFSGHIHIPNFDEGMGLYNLGSCYPLNFADANDDRYFYIWDDKNLTFKPNLQSIHFWRIRNEQIFNEMHDINDHYELYISQSNMQQEKYQSRLVSIANQYKNISIIPIIDEKVFEGEQLESYNIDEICKNSIPDHLYDKFEQIIKYINMNDN